MAKRKHISLKTKLAAALLAIGEIPYDDAKEMGEANFLSLWTFDHGILHAVDPVDYYWNLTPRLIKPHREKSRKDVAIIAKIKRIIRKVAEHQERSGGWTVMSVPSKPKKWPKIPSRPFPKKHRPLRGWKKR